MSYEQAPFDEDDDEAGPPLLSERLRRLTPLVVLLVALMVVTVGTAFNLRGPFGAPVVFVCALLIVGVIVIVVRRSREDREYGPGAYDDDTGGQR